MSAETRTTEQARAEVAGGAGVQGPASMPAPVPASVRASAPAPASVPATAPAPVLVDADADAEAGVRATAAGAAARRALLAHPALLLIGIVLASLNMRVALASVAPLVGEISGAFGLSATATSLVTSVPVLFLGVGALVAPWLGRRFGAERVLFAALLLLGVGILARVLPSVYALYGGGILVGTAIALLNVLMPGLIKRDFPDRAAAMTSVYTGAMIMRRDGRGGGRGAAGEGARRRLGGLARLLVPARRGRRGGLAASGPDRPGPYGP